MLATLFFFSLLTYGLAFLLADAKIFGCPTKAYMEDPTDADYIKRECVLPIRQIFLKLRFFQVFLACYFCIGVWCGALTHLLFLLLYHVDKSVPLLSSYFLLSSSRWGIVVSTCLAAVIGGVVCYCTDLVVRWFESKVRYYDGSN